MVTCHNASIPFLSDGSLKCISTVSEVIKGKERGGSMSEQGAIWADQTLK